MGLMESGRPLAQRGPGRARFAVALSLVLFVLALATPAARAEGVPATPIPQNPPDLAAVPAFAGAPAVPKAISAPKVPQNPFMAPNGRSNLHDDAFMTNTYTWSAPLGSGMQVLSTFQGADCASVTVDSAGVTVRDHGDGIAEADVPHVFDRFYRGVNSRARQGSGLGLAIVRQVAEQHHGTVTAANAADGGAVFTLRLPTSPVASSGVPDDAGMPSDTEVSA